jgi:hypothetical protein
MMFQRLFQPDRLIVKHGKFGGSCSGIDDQYSFHCAPPRVGGNLLPHFSS